MGVFCRLVLYTALASQCWVSDGKGKKKKFKNSHTFEGKIKKLAGGDNEQHQLLLEVVGALRGRDSEAWVLSEGSNVLEPYAVGSTKIVDALELRQDEPEMWALVDKWSEAALAGDGDALSNLERQMKRWSGLADHMVDTHSREVTNAAAAVSWFAKKVLAATACLGQPRCDKPTAWHAGRTLHDAAFNHAAGSKWGRVLETHDIELATTDTMLQLAERLAKLYELDLRERPKEMDAKRQQAMEVKATAAAADEDAVELVDAGALDKDWPKLSDVERALAEQLGYNEASFAKTVPPIPAQWVALSVEKQGVATKLGWDAELWDNEIDAMSDLGEL